MWSAGRTEFHSPRSSPIRAWLQRWRRSSARGAHGEASSGWCCTRSSLRCGAQGAPCSTPLFADSRLGPSVTALLCPWARGEAFTPDVDRMVLEHPQFASLIESCRGAPNVELRAHRVPLTLLFTDSGLGATVVALLSPWEHPHSLAASGRGVTPNVELPGAPCSIRAAARPVVNRSLRQSTNCFRAPRFGAAAVVRPMVERSLRQRVVLEHSLLDGDWGCSGRSGARITASRPTG